MTVSRKTLIIAETFFQDEVILNIDEKTSSSSTILEILNAKKVSINQSCGGMGTCGTCRFEIIEGSEALMPPSDYEIEQSQELQLQVSQRLSCQTQINWNSLTNIKIIRKDPS